MIETRIVFVCQQSGTFWYCERAVETDEQEAFARNFTL